MTREKLNPKSWRVIRQRMLDEVLDQMDVHPDNWVWCLHCKRCYRYRDAAWNKGTAIFRCAYWNCDGGLLGDAFPWSSIREAGGYPEAPNLNTRYPQFGGEPFRVEPERKGFGSPEMIGHIIETR